ncbi:cobalamin B12-binding domain-containing protein [Roseovarius aquimarinus]|uniref:Cobalamin B12-binding domain-containing protein n=1 Tax=Roseovarius aquimarinus TaxID=1229156 RepID=A0ABW7I309_9RHOB
MNAPITDDPLGGIALGDPALAPGRDLLAEGRAMARDWRLGRSAFMAAEGVTSEAEYKRRAMAEGRMMQHAHIGFRSIDRTVEAMGALHARAAEQGARIDRFGITLDWTMGYPADRRADLPRGTGIVLTGPEDFARITGASPAAAHFGDFMLGLPGALDNTRAAIAAGATAIGNLGQYFTFRLPYWDDDVATTEATLRALGLIAAQEAEILVHSNLDDGFAGLFLDMTSAFGMALIEKHIVEDLVGAPLAFCFGHHFSAPLTRAAFQAALARETATPGTMIFGNTVAYQGVPAQNYASLASYLLADLCALGKHHSGHAVNPVPVTENQRIPDIDEILEAQLFAARLAAHAPGHGAVRNDGLIESMADRLVAGGRAFAEAALAGLAERGVDTDDPAALMLAIRRLGARRMEALFGQGAMAHGARVALVAADWAEELDEMAAAWVARQEGARLARRVALGTTDVHEHGAYLVRRALTGLGAEVIEAGVAVDAEVMVARALEAGADAIAVSTYNGIGLGYARRLMAELEARGARIPVIMGGKLNEIPQDSNSSLPIDVTAQIRASGVHPCAGLDDMLAALRP